MHRAMASALRVAIVDPDAAARSRLRRTLDQIAGPPASIVLECATAEALLFEAPRLPLDAVFVDIVMPGGWELTGTDLWGSHRPEFVVVTAHTEHASRAFDLAAADYLTKPVSEARLQMTLSRLWRHRRTAGALGHYDPGETSRPLTERQADVLNLLGQGLTNKAIARAFGLSHFTIRNHVSELFRLFGVSRRGDLARAARMAGLVMDGETASSPLQASLRHEPAMTNFHHLVSPADRAAVVTLKVA